MLERPAGHETQEAVSAAVGVEPAADLASRPGVKAGAFGGFDPRRPRGRQVAAKLKQRAKADFRDLHHEAALIVQAVSWYLRDPLSYRDIEQVRLERGLEVNTPP